MFSATTHTQDPTAQHWHPIMNHVHLRVHLFYLKHKHKKLAQICQQEVT
jgi:hypothetical protein